MVIQFSFGFFFFYIHVLPGIYMIQMKWIFSKLNCITKSNKSVAVETSLENDYNNNSG